MKHRVAVVLAVALTGVVPAPAQDLSVKEIYARAGVVRAATLDKDVSVTVARPGGVRLDYAKNEVGLASAVILFGEDGQVWVAARDTAGNALHRSSANKAVEALIIQLGGLPVLAIAQWSQQSSPQGGGGRGGDHVSMCVRLSTDAKHNAAQRALAKTRRKRGKRTAVMIQNTGLLAAVELSENERVAGFARLWSEVKYNFAFFDQVPELDWDAEFAKTLPAVRAARTAPEYYRVLERSMAKLKDGHTSIWGPGIGQRGSAWLPVKLAFDTERRLRIAGVVQHASVRSLVSRGERVTHWNGRPIDEMLDADVRPSICASTPHGSDLSAARRLQSGDYGSRVKLTVVGDDGKARELELQRARHPLPSSARRGFEVRELDGGVLYINLPSFGSKRIVRDFQAELERVRAAKAVILDVRGNGGGNSRYGWQIASYFLDKAIPKTRWKTRMYRPAYRAWGREEAWHKGKLGRILPARKPFLGPLAILVGPRTFSAAEDFVVVLHAAKRATLVGRPTGGSTGQPLRIKLPGGGGARVCTKRDTYPDGRDFVGVGVIPDVLVDPLATSGDAADPDADPELARTLQLIKDGLVRGQG